MSTGRKIVALAGALLLIVACSPEPADDGAASEAAPEREPAGTEARKEPGAQADAEEEPPPGPDEEPPSESEDEEDSELAFEHRPANPAPMRGAWVHLFDDALKSRDGIAAIVDELAAGGASAVVAQVVRRHDAYYASDVLPATPDPDLEADLDVLDELLSAAHAQDLEVHAWVTVAPTWHDVYEALDAPAGWLAAEHGREAPEPQRWVTRTVDGVWSEFLDPALPEVQEHVAAVAGELAERYPVDGIHLDYVRYASEQHGYHPDALERYRSETGAEGTPAPDDAAWSAWRRDQTRAVIERAGAAVEASGSDVTLSAAVITWGSGPGAAETPGFADTRAYREALQDWPSWARDGLVDAVMPMNYFRAHVDEQAGWFENWTTFQHELAEVSDARIIPGVAGWLNAPDAVVDQVGKGAGADGALVYSFQQPTEDASRDLWQHLSDEGWGATESDP